MSNFKKQKVADIIHGFLASEVRRLGDPRLELVSITAVNMSPDLKNAMVFWSAFDVTSELRLGDKEISETPLATPEAKSFDFTPDGISAAKIAVIDKAFEEISYHLKKRIAQELSLRFTPKLSFKYDATLITASRIETLLKSN